MSARTAVTTPVKNLATPPVQDSPGNWRHPRLQEITRRQEASTFTDKNFKRIAYNTGALIALYITHALVIKSLPSKRSGSAHLHRYAHYGLILFLLVPVYNIFMNLLPLLRAKDDLSDIPLTPGQRKLLGLGPSSAPPTPGSAYSTPPRYSRKPSGSGSAGRRSASGSPLSNRSPLSNQGSPTPAGVASPSNHHLLQRAMLGARRSSIGSLGSPASPSASLFGGPSPESPSPSPAGKRSTVGINSKWRYEKGMYEKSTGFRDSLSANTMYT